MHIKCIWLTDVIKKKNISVTVISTLHCFTGKAVLTSIKLSMSYALRSGSACYAILVYTPQGIWLNLSPITSGGSLQIPQMSTRHHLLEANGILHPHWCASRTRSKPSQNCSWVSGDSCCKLKQIKQPWSYHVQQFSVYSFIYYNFYFKAQNKALRCKQ